MNKWKFVEYLNKAGYTQSSYAKETSKSLTTLNRKLNGHGNFDTKEIEEFCALCNIYDPKIMADIFLP